jgi:hypothetical protein
MENWDATHDDEKIEKLSQIIQLISTRIKDLRFLFQKQKLALQKFWPGASFFPSTFSM